MDNLERADVLLAQLELLLAAGRIDAATSLSGVLRAVLRDETDHRADVVTLVEADRVTVLEPLGQLLRLQRALDFDILAAGEQRAGLTRGEARDRISGLIREISQEFAGLAGCRPDAPDLAIEISRVLRDLRIGIDELNLRRAQDGAADLRELAELPLPANATRNAAGQHASAALFLLDSLADELGPDAVFAQLGGLVERQGALLRQLAPLLKTPSEHLSEAHESLHRAGTAMQASRELLSQQAFAEARVHAKGALDALVETLRIVDSALVAATVESSTPPGFLRPFDSARRPEWQLPAALGLHLHERLKALLPEGPLKDELMRLVKRLIDPNPEDTWVSLNRMGARDGRMRRFDVLTILGGRDQPTRRYRVRLSFMRGPTGELEPLHHEDAEAIETFGGRARALLSTELAECAVTVLRFEDDGPGPAPTYTDLDEGPDLRDLLPGRTGAAPTGSSQSPVRADVLAFLDSLMATPDDSPLSEAQLKALGISWYDVANLVDRLRPVQESLEFELYDMPEGERFVGMAWAGVTNHAFASIHFADDGRTPRIAMRTALVAWLGWAARNEFGDREVSPNDLLVALQLNLGLKLAFFDALSTELHRTEVHGAARALEAAFLRSRGLPPTALRDLLTKAASDHQADLRAGGVGRLAWERVGENLFAAHAGEKLVRETRLPASVLFGPMRGLLAADLRRQGLMAAAQSADGLDAFADVAVLFGNLVVDPSGSAGILILGDSKIGKSSITARLVTGDKQNPPWRFGASDRVLVLMPGPGIGGSTTPLAIASPAHRSFGNWTQDLWYRDEQNREVRPRDQVVSRDLVPIQAVAFLRRDGADQRGSLLSPPTVADLVRDFQHRFGFPASRRFWHSLFSEVAVLDVPLAYRGADTFLEAASDIRGLLADAELLRGAGARRLAVGQAGGAWFGISYERTQMRVTRVGPDGIDVDYLLHENGSTSVLPAQIGREVAVKTPGSFEIERVGSRVLLERGRVERLRGYPMYRLTSSRWMPLSDEYFVVEAGAPFFMVPDLPPEVGNVVRRLLRATDPARWQRYFAEPSPMG